MFFSFALLDFLANATILKDSSQSIGSLFLSHLCHWLKNITSQHINDKWPIKLTWFNPLWLWRWLPHRLSKSQSLSTTTVLFRTTFNRWPLTQPTSEAVHPDIFCDWLSDYMTSFKEWVSQQKSDNLHVSRSFGRMLSINEKNKSNSQLLKGSITVLYLANFSCMSTGQASTKYSKILKSKERDFLQIPQTNSNMWPALGK